MKRKKITLITPAGRIVTNLYGSLVGAIRGTGTKAVNAAKIEPLPFCGVGPCDDSAGCDVLKEQAQ